MDSGLGSAKPIAYDATAGIAQTTIAAAQRLAGALIGAAAAALLLLIPASEHGLRLFAASRGLEVVALVILMHGAAIPLLELRAVLRGHRCRSADPARPSAALQLRRRRLPDHLDVVQRVLGHATASMTMDLYGHLVDGNLWQAAQVIGGISGASGPPELPDEEADAAEPDGNAW